MSGPDFPRLSRRAAGALLDGHPEDGGHGRLAALLAAVSVEPLVATTPGELTARVAYRARAELGPAPRSWMRARSAAVRACAVTATGMVVAVTGLAFTAGAGDLPPPLQNAAHDAFGVPPPHGHPRLPGPAPSDHDRATSHSRSEPKTTPSPSADLTALCRTYQASVVPAPPVHTRDSRHARRPRNSDSYQQPTAWPIASPTTIASADPEWLVTLAAAAGGRERVATFCQERLASATSGSASPAPGGGDVAPTTGSLDRNSSQPMGDPSTSGGRY